MSDRLLLVEPPGQTSKFFAHLAADRLQSGTEIVAALRQRGRQALWVVSSTPAVSMLLEAFPHRPSKGHRLLSLAGSAGARHALLHAHFRFVVSADEGVRLLPMEELAEVLGSGNRADLFIGAVASRADDTIILYRGNLEPLVIPVSWFRTRPEGPMPDISDLSITDFGQTVRLGKYEAATDAILYEFDDQYRQRSKERQVQTDRSLGAALRRLRLQKGLRQSDFPDITDKEIARIERGEVKKPRKGTLAKIARRLGVAAEDISTF
jgi:hypothetical protein